MKSVKGFLQIFKIHRSLYCRSACSPKQNHLKFFRYALYLLRHLSLDQCLSHPFWLMEHSGLPKVLLFPSSVLWSEHNLFHPYNLGPSPFQHVCCIIFNLKSGFSAPTKLFMEFVSHLSFLFSKGSSECFAHYLLK